MLYYVTNNIERMVGIDLEMYPDVHVITNSSPLADAMHEKYPDRITLNKGEFLNTLDLLKEFGDQIEKGGKVMTFKNTIHIQRYCEEQGWNNVHPDAALGKQLEVKTSQYEWLKENRLDTLLPETMVGELGSFDFEDLEKQLGLPFIAQYNTGHTGSGTLLISDERAASSARGKWANEVERFPKRDARISKFITGKVYTINTCVFPDEIRCGRTSLQLTGIKDIVDNPLATVGNDWSAVSDEDHERVKQMAQQLGPVMRESGWKGLFGIDVVIEEESGKAYLIEINARQAASASFENRLANLQGGSGPLDWQLSALADRDSRFKIQDLSLTASQVFLRKDSGELFDVYGKLEKVGEYDESIELVESKPLFDLGPDSKHTFVTPKATNSEIVRIQAQNLQQWLRGA